MAHPRRIIVMGGAYKIGRAITEAFLSEGSTVVVGRPAPAGAGAVAIAGVATAVARGELRTDGTVVGVATGTGFNDTKAVGHLAGPEGCLEWRTSPSFPRRFTPSPPAESLWDAAQADRLCSPFPTGPDQAIEKGVHSLPRPTLFSLHESTL